MIKKLHILLTIVLMLLFAAFSIVVAFTITNSKYFASISKNLHLIASSDKVYTYYLYDANGSSTGYFTDASTISQQFTVRATPSQTIYQVKLPISEAGYYTLDFYVDFSKPNAGQSSSANDLILNNKMTNAVGCQVVHATSEKKVLTMMSTNPAVEFANDRAYSTQPLYSSDDRYQWKTTAPSLGENVTLTFKVNESDVKTGYVLWAWEFTGLTASTTYILDLQNIKVEKITTLSEDNKDPYFNFAQTSYVNNVVLPETSHTASVYLAGSSTKTTVTGYQTAGFTRHLPGRGTFVTEATDNSLTMQVSPLYAGFVGSTPMVGSDQNSSKNETFLYNYNGFNIPIKNIEYDTNYKVSFDFSVARQGTSATHASTTTLADVLYDSAYENFFQEFASTNNSRALTFQSYIHSGKIADRSQAAHMNGRAQITMANKAYPAHEVTRYDELRKYATASTSYEDYHYNSKLNINYLGNQRGSNNNTMNSVRHTEINGQNTIYWYTFYNTTFTFNISSEKNSGLNLNDLYWVWAIDALDYAKYYRIKIENVRIEKVMQYGADIPKNGIKINGTIVSEFNQVGDGATYGPENYLRGSSGTGQNYQALAYGTGVSMAAINTFGPIYDAKDVVFTSDSANDYKISIDGYCVCDGGVEKYVWSPDLGKTWHDMIIESPLDNATTTMLDDAERRVDQRQIAYYDSNNISRGSTHSSALDSKANLDFVDFTSADSKNSDFSEFRLTADISAYKHYWNMEIIFAAVPVDHEDMRCEILRITNVNPKHAYRSYMKEIRSDIDVVKDYTNYNPSSLTDEIDTTTETKKINAVVDGSTSGDVNWKTASYVKPFSSFYGTDSTGATVKTSGYTHSTNSNSIYDTRTLFSGIPVKKSIYLEGWAIVTGGTDSYWYSVDNGKTWSEITSAVKLDGSINDELFKSDCTKWLNESVTETHLLGAYHKLTIDLSEYVGEMVNLLVSLKPIGKDTLCPIAKVINISVCGDHMYYSRYNSITIDDTLVIDSSSSDLIKYNKLDLTTTTINGYSYSYYEPYNIDLTQSKKITTAPIAINNGGKISIDGFVVGTGGIKEYKYSLDNGKTWSVINIGENFAGVTTAIFKASKLIDWNLNATSGANGNFSSLHGQTRRLEMNIPNTFASGEKVDIIIVAVSNDEEQAMYPIMNATLMIQ